MSRTSPCLDRRPHGRATPAAVPDSERRSFSIQNQFSEAICGSDSRQIFSSDCRRIWHGTGRENRGEQVAWQMVGHPSWALPPRNISQLEDILRMRATSYGVSLKLFYKYWWPLSIVIQNTNGNPIYPSLFQALGATLLSLASHHLARPILGGWVRLKARISPVAW